MELSKDVLEDLTYLQKQMRLTIKYHQQLSEILSSKVKGGVNYSAVSQKRTNQIRNLMEFLEGEMEEITQEQIKIILFF
ncbi:CLUMA_CG015655, isoform A [Clunio marinus]|uniref:CLUMA_CG015655, isoform A n=1 Tax=Clunio marinus TaxID=568069 RepID=A0A1J1IPA1_9DIPT|nr:CLUMA_CG015655, isoform A [Clunio marinus]